MSFRCTEGHYNIKKRAFQDLIEGTVNPAVAIRACNDGRKGVEWGYEDVHRSVVSDICHSIRGGNADVPCLGKWVSEL